MRLLLSLKAIQDREYDNNYKSPIFFLQSYQKFTIPSFAWLRWKGQGKPNPRPYQTALQRMNLKPSQAIIIENSPLGVEAANNAGIPFIVTLNNTPLDISSDYEFLMRLDESERRNRIFKDTKAASSFLKDWCCKEWYTLDTTSIA